MRLSRISKLCLWLVLIPCTVFAVTLTWDLSEPTPEGYRIYCREDGESYDYTTPVWEGPLPPSEVPLSEGLVWYCVARAFDGELESENSNEVRWTSNPLDTQGFQLSWTEIAVADHALATVDNPAVALTDFTLIVDLSDMPANWWSAVDTSDGTKGRVYKGDGSTRLACDWIDFDDTAETGLLRVLWAGTLATTGTQQLWIEPPVAANASVAADNTYGSDNAYDEYWEGYWPLEESSGDPQDRTAHGLHATTTNGSPTQGATGKVGSGITLDGSTTSFEAPSCPVTGPPLTLMGWANGQTESDVILTLQGLSSNDTYNIGTGSSGGVVLKAIIGSTGMVFSPSLARPPSGWWHAALVCGSTTSRYLYLNSQQDTESTDELTATLSSPVVGLGALPRYDSQEWDGSIDELQVHSVARSATWISHEYAQTNDNSTFWGTWSWVSGGGGSAALPMAMNYYRRMRD